MSFATTQRTTTTGGHMANELRHEEKQILHDFTYIWKLKQSDSQKQNQISDHQGRDWGGKQQYWSKGTKFQLCNMKNFLRTKLKHREHSYNTAVQLGFVMRVEHKCLFVLSTNIVKFSDPCSRVLSCTNGITKPTKDIAKETESLDQLGGMI